jgi:hypothetical protein
MQRRSVHDCSNAILRVLTSDEVEFLKRLFTLAKRRAPDCEAIGVVDLSQSPECGSCSFMFSWGHAHYCTNIDAIRTKTAPEDGERRPR